MLCCIINPKKNGIDEKKNWQSNTVHFKLFKFSLIYMRQFVLLKYNANNVLKEYVKLTKENYILHDYIMNLT